MSATVDDLGEPHVLAHAKRSLFSDGDDANYTVVDTQFSTTEWRPGRVLETDVLEALAPFNRVAIGGGYPDLVGVGRPAEGLLAVDRFGSEPPLVVVEAKGYTDRGVDTERGIVQAHDRLHEANAAYLAAPCGAISQTDRTLARELNVGILGVEPDGTVRPLERPRVVGNRTSAPANAIRFQASAQGVAHQSFGLNHPKNYLGYPLAHYAAGETPALLEQYDVVGAVDEARRGAEFLSLIETRPSGVVCTPLGQEVIRFALERHGSVISALETFGDWYRSRKRFVDLDPAWGQLARRIVYQYPATSLLVTELQALAADGKAEPTLVEFVERLHQLHPTFAIELFIRGDEATRRQVLSPDNELRLSALENGSVYHAPTVFQLKAMYYHTGILATRGSEPHRLDPLEDQWGLRQPV